MMDKENTAFKILQVNNVYRKGSTGKITYDIHSYLCNKKISSIVCYGRGEIVHESNVYKICGELYSKINNLISRLTGVMYGGCFFSTKKLIDIIEKEKPNVVHLQCLNGYFVNIYRLIEYLKIHKIKTVLTLHAEFMHTANCGYALDCEKWKTGCGNCPRLKKETKSLLLDNTHRSWTKMKAAFDGFENGLTVVSVSPWLMERAKVSPILSNKKHTVVLNGLDTDVFHIYDKKEIIDKHHISGKKIVFHVTGNFCLDPNHIKGGYYVNKIAEQFLNENVVFIVAGKYDESAVYSKNIIFLGKIDDQKELAKYYSAADITLLTSRKETFSMVTAESLCCGTPIVGFKAGAPEMITIQEYSEFVSWGDIKEIEEAIKRFLAFTYNKNTISDEAKKKYAKETMTEQYIKLYHEMTK